MRVFLTLLLLTFACQAQDWIPKDAKVVYSSAQHDGFLPDGEVALKIQATEEQFDKIVKTLKLTLHTEGRVYTDDKEPWLNWSPKLDGMLESVKGEDQWNPSSDLSKTYVRQEGDTWEYAKYENGYVYYRWLNH